MPSPLVSDSRGVENVQTDATGLEYGGDNVDEACEMSPPGSPSNIQEPMDTYLTTASRATTEGSTPQHLRKATSERVDHVSKGLITLEVAQALVHRYLTHLDRFLYGIASHFTDVHHVRRTSAIPLAAMCAVTATQQPDREELFKVCSKEYRSLVSVPLFE